MIRPALFTATSALAFGLSCPVQAATITVRDGESIQAAVDRATSGDTVIVGNGTYDAFSVEKSGITVKSGTVGGAHVRSSTGRAIQSWGNSNVTISGFRVTAATDGVAVGGSPGNLVSKVEVSNIVVEDAGADGIKLAQITDSKIIGNKILSAGSAMNANGDGGIDCVTCQNSVIQYNNVSGTKGWAALMLKTNSTGNRITHNTLANQDEKGVAMTVGGVSGGRAAESEGVSGQGGSEASNNLISNNVLQSAGCALYFSDAQNNQLSNNSIGQARNCATTQGSNNAQAKVAVSRSTASAQSDTSRALESIGNNIGDTDEQILQAVVRGQAGGYSRLTRMMEMDFYTRMVNREINKGTRAVTREIYGVVDDATDFVMEPISGAVAGIASYLKCNIMGAMVGAAGQAVGAVFSGGRATAAAQITDYFLQAQKYLCDARNVILQERQLSAQRNQLEVQKRMIRGIDEDFTGFVESMEDDLKSLLGMEDADTYSEEVGVIHWETYQQGLPEGFDFDSAEKEVHHVRLKADAAAREATIVRVGSRAMTEEMLRVAEDAQQVSQRAVGQTQAIQAQTAMTRAKIGIDAAADMTREAQENAMLAAQEEQRYRERVAKQKRAFFYRRSADTGTAASASGPLFQ